MRRTASSNRTFMELKFGYTENDILSYVSSNRTFMELKLLCDYNLLTN